ncbi:hypothetical protein V8E36_003639 [Tilletia maclaganii]
MASLTILVTICPCVQHISTFLMACVPAGRACASERLRDDAHHPSFLASTRPPPHATFLSFSPLYRRSHYDERFASTRAKLTRPLRSPGPSITLSLSPPASRVTITSTSLRFNGCRNTHRWETHPNEEVHRPALRLRYPCRRRVDQCTEGVRDPEELEGNPGPASCAQAVV